MFFVSQNCVNVAADALKNENEMRMKQAILSKNFNILILFGLVSSHLQIKFVIDFLVKSTNTIVRNKLLKKAYNKFFVKWCPFSAENICKVWREFKR